MLFGEREKLEGSSFNARDFETWGTMMRAVTSTEHHRFSLHLALSYDQDVTEHIT